MFSKTAQYYDLFYSFKDYEKEAQQIKKERASTRLYKKQIQMRPLGKLLLDTIAQ